MLKINEEIINDFTEYILSKIPKAEFFIFNVKDEWDPDVYYTVNNSIFNLSYDPKVGYINTCTTEKLKENIDKYCQNDLPRIY